MDSNDLGDGSGIDPAAAASSSQSLTDVRVAAAVQAARYWGVDPDPREFRRPTSEPYPSSASLTKWLTETGLWAKATRLKFSQLFRFSDGEPVLLMFTDGTAGILAGADEGRRVVFVRDPLQPETIPPVPVDELRLSQVWAGETILVRRTRGDSAESMPFGFPLIFKYVLMEKKMLKDIGIASFVMAFTQIITALLFMGIINSVMIFRVYATLNFIALTLACMILLEMFLSWARRELVVVSAARIDGRLNLLVLERLLGLSMAYFERTPVGSTLFAISQLARVREFFTGRALSTMLDLVTLTVMIPVLFIINASLTWVIVAASVAIAIMLLFFLPTLRYLTGLVIKAEVAKGTAMAENIHGIRTLKSLALEPVRKSEYDVMVADLSYARERLGLVSNWPATLAMPLEFIANRGVVLIGAYLYLAGNSDINSGTLMAMMILGGRVAAPLVSLAKLLEELEDMRAAMGAVASTINQPPETRNPGRGIRPRFAGAVTFSNVNFTYPGSERPALKNVNFEIPPGTMLGLVGRSGSGKSTITRLLQGINMEYTGSVKIDGADLKEINLSHLRRSFGVVLQENFLFRGTIKDNILAGRIGLTLEDAIRAARLAGADEFIEKLPAGYESYIYEGSPNLSGGQRQRLAIARALVSDPRIMVLDEATSALDPESEALVNANLLRIGRGRTMFIVSHRLSSLIDSDLILVMDQGQVVDLAPHTVLLERCVIYRQLWQQQNRFSVGGNKLALAAPGAEGKE